MRVNVYRNFSRLCSQNTFSVKRIKIVTGVNSVNVKIIFYFGGGQR